jgi:hypothetical protein
MECECNPCLKAVPVVGHVLLVGLSKSIWHAIRDEPTLFYYVS